MDRLRCQAPGCHNPLNGRSYSADFCSEWCRHLWMAEYEPGPDVPLIGQQQPTYLWVPSYETTLGLEVVDLSADVGQPLDPWQQQAIINAFAEDPFGAWLCFEVALILSRQNGKGTIFEAIELAWLLLFREKLVVHTAHLFETSRNHFKRMVTLIENNDDLRRRFRKPISGRGSEEISTLGGSTLRFFTRSEAAGRGFTGGKLVYDEAMMGLDAGVMAATVPTLATDPNAQIWYAGSAGNRQATQLASLRRRGLAGGDPALMLAMWEAHLTAVDDADDAPLDDPADPRTWAKTNPSFNIRLREKAILKEMTALGGATSAEFWKERLGVGDWPADDDGWSVIGKTEWEACHDPASWVPPATSVAGQAGRIAVGIDLDDVRGVGTVVVHGWRADGLGHIEVVQRHRGIAWVPGWLAPRLGITLARAAELGVQLPGYDSIGVEPWPYRLDSVVLLRDGGAAPIVDTLQQLKLPVHCPTAGEYATACNSFKTDVVERAAVRHLGQGSLDAAVAAGQKVSVGTSGAWRWDPTVGVDQAPLRAATLARLGGQQRAATPWALTLDELVGGGRTAEVPAVAGRRGPAGLAAARGR